MRRWTQRVCALAVLFLLIAAQVHVILELGPAQGPRHACEFCVSGAWAIVSVSPALEVALQELRRLSEPAAKRVPVRSADTAAARAPPFA